MEKLQVIMFDLDDTLYDFSGNWDAALRDTMQNHSLTGGLAQQEVIDTFNYFSSMLWEKLDFRQTSFNEYRYERLSRTLETFRVQLTREAFEEFNHRFIQTSLGLIRKDESLRLLMEQWLRQYKLCIITNGPSDIAGKKIKRLGLEGVFPAEAIFVSENIGVSKPHPDIFRHALNHFGIDSGNALFVGDSWDHDVVGAAGAGIPAVWLNRRNHPAPELAAHQLLGTIRELQELAEYLKSH